MKIDPYKSKEKYLEWKENVKERIPDISESNSIFIKKYLEDMEDGFNVSKKNRKGPRSYIRLNTLRTRIILLSKMFEKKLAVLDITKITEKQLIQFFSAMRNGNIRKKNGCKYKSTQDYVKVFKAFWHWYMKFKKKTTEEKIPDITEDLDTSGSKPKWVYLTQEQIKELTNNVKYEYKVLITFLLDTGIRSPTELINVKVSDISNNHKELHIKAEISKTFERKMKLMICSDLLKEYIKTKQLKSEDYLFPINQGVTNRYLKRTAKKLFGDSKSPAGKPYSQLTMYDFRHISCCYWLPKYKTESALKYRFGWKKSDKIHYYSEYLGMKDTITEKDLLEPETQTEIQKQLLQTQNENQLLKERITHMETQMQQILQLTNELHGKIGNSSQN